MSEHGAAANLDATSLPVEDSVGESGSRSWFTLSTSHEERYFLLLAVFIGLFSGLAVVCFRLAIDWTRIWLLGTGIRGPQLAACRYTRGRRIGCGPAGDPCIPAGPGQWSEPDQGGALYL